MDFVAPVYKNGSTYLSSIVFYSDEMNQNEICAQVFNALIHNTDVPKDAKLITICTGVKTSINITHRFEYHDFDLNKTIKSFTIDENPYLFRGTDEKSAIYYYGNTTKIDSEDFKKLFSSLPDNLEITEMVTIKA